MASANITFNCPGCGREFNVDAQLKGKKIRCSQCKRLSLIPSSSKAGPPTPAAASPDPPAAEKDPENGFRSTSDPKTQISVKPPEQANVPRKARIRIVPPARKTVPTNPHEVSAPEPADPESPPESVKKGTAPESDGQPGEAPAASSGNAPPTPPVHSTTSKGPATPASPAASSADDADELRKQLQKAQQDLAGITTAREREEIAYSRTIAKLSTQLHNATRQCEAMTEELNALRGAKQRQQNEVGPHEAEYRKTIENIKKAVDEFCNAQLSGMQKLRQTVKTSLKP